MRSPALARCWLRKYLASIRVAGVVLALQGPAVDLLGRQILRVDSQSWRAALKVAVLTIEADFLQHARRR